MKPLSLSLIPLTALLLSAPAGPLAGADGPAAAANAAGTPAKPPEDEIENAFRDALYAEEVKGDTEAALKAYQEVAAKFEQQRDMAATALFRQAECLRKLDRKDEAVAIYKKVLAQYGDKERTAKLSRENLAALGQPVGQGTPAEAAEASQDSAEIAKLEKLLKDSPDLINAADASSNPLWEAVGGGQVAIVDYLLTKGARLDTLVEGKAALHRAAEAGHLTICQKLIEKGAHVNFETSGGATALLLALNSRRFAIVEFLLGNHADPNAGMLRNGNETSYTITTALAQRAPVALTLQLMQKGADPSRPRESQGEGHSSKRWPLGEAIRLKEAAIVAGILEKGFPPVGAVSWEQSDGRDLEELPMTIAMQQAAPSAPDATDDAIVELLRKHGADLNHPEVMTAAVQKGLTGYIRTAAKDGASPDALQTAISAEKEEALRTLLELGADPAKKFPNSSDDAMSMAVSNQKPEVIKLLLDAGYPLKDYIVALTSAAAWFAFPAKGKPSAEALAIYEQMAGAARQAGKLEEALTSVLNSNVESFTRDNGFSELRLNTAALLAAGANAAKSGALKELFGNRNLSYGMLWPDFVDLWKLVRISQNPELRTAVWLSRGPSLCQAARTIPNYFSGNNRFPDFRPVVFENSIVPPGSLGHALSNEWTSSENDLAHITIHRLNAEGKIKEHPVDFTAIARGGDPAKDFALQWGDVIEIPLLEPPVANIEELRNFMDMDRWYSSTDIRFSIGNDQWVVNATNEKGPVLRLPANSEVLASAGMPGVSSPQAVLKISWPGGGEKALEGSPSEVLTARAFHGGIIRVEPPARELSLNDEALRDAFTLAVSRTGPFLRLFPETMAEILKSEGGARGRELLIGDPPADPAAKDAPSPVIPRGKLLPQEMPVPTLRDVLLMLHGPNPTGFGPVNWPAAKLCWAIKHGWEEMPMDKADLTWPVVPGMVLVLPPLEPGSPVPPNTFDYSACAFDFEITIGDRPPVKLRFQPPVPELKREGNKWLWSWKRKEGDSGFAWPDLYSLLSGIPEISEWPAFYGTMKLSGVNEMAFSKESLLKNGGLWLQRDWTHIRVENGEAPLVPPTGQPNRKRIVVPSQ